MANTYLEYNELNLALELKTYLSGSSSTTEPDRVVIDKAIKYAEGKVNSRLGIKYTLPVAAADETDFIKSIVHDITIWRLYKDSPSLQIPEKVQLGYEEAIDDLDALAKGNAKIGADTDDEKEAKTTAFGKFVRG